VVEGGVMAGLKKERKLADLPCHAMPGRLVLSSSSTNRVSL